MPNCIEFVSKKTGKAERFDNIDDKMRIFFGEAPDPSEYLYHWYDVIALAGAMGKTWKEIKALSLNENLRQVVEYLEQRYDLHAWAER